jgi:hypothetical protein
VTRQPISFYWLASRVALPVILLAGRAGATQDLDRARMVFREGLVLEVAGDWASALAKFQVVAGTRLTPQVRYHLARCKENLGRLTEALGDYRVAEAEARAVALPETSEIERARRDLEARIPRLLLRSTASGGEFSVELDGIVLGSSVLNRPMVVNPGRHRITLRDALDVPRESFIIAEESKITEVDLGGFDQRFERPRGAIDIKSADGRRGSPPAWAYVSAGIGTAAIVSSVVLFVVRDRAKHELEQNCARQVCPESMRAVQQRGEIASSVAPIALGLGVVGIGLAAWGLFGGVGNTDLNRGRLEHSTVSVLLGPGHWGVNLAANY